MRARELLYGDTIPGVPKLLDEGAGAGGGGGGAAGGDANAGGTPAGGDANAGGTAPATVLGGAGGPGDWRSALPDDIKNDASLVDIKDVTGLAKGFIHAQRMVGANKIALPGEGATQDQWNEFFTVLGRPKEVTEYDLTFDGKNLMEEDPLMKSFAENAHRVGLTQSQARELAQWSLTAASEQETSLIAENDQHREEVMTKLRTTYGEALDAKIESAQLAIQAFGGEDLEQILETTGLGDNPVIIETFIKIGAALSEDALGPAFRHNAGGMTPEEAQNRIVEINTELMKIDPMDPRKKGLLDEKIRLAQAAHPKDAAEVAVTRV